MRVALPSPRAICYTGGKGDPAMGVPQEVSHAVTISTPLVAMAANVFRENVEKCLEACMNDHIGKPLDFNEVMIMLRKYMN